MIKTPTLLQDLRRKIYIQAKADKDWRFWGLYVHICKMETLQEAYKLAKQNNGAPGIDGTTFDAIEATGVTVFLEQIQQELQSRSYYPQRNREKVIPKPGGKFRTLGIPTIKDRVVQGAAKLILEPIFEADFQEGSFGYRPKRTAAQAVERVTVAAIKNKTKVIDIDLKAYFDSVKHDILLAKIAQRVNDGDIMHLLKLMLKAGGKLGVPQGGTISPLLSNIYLNEVDKMLEKAKQVTSIQDGYQHIEYSRFADDLVILVDSYHKWNWLLNAAYIRVCEEFTKLGVTLNLDKTKIIDLKQNETFNFLGFTFRRTKTKNGKWGISKIPKKEARAKLITTVKAVFKSHRSQPISRVIYLINPILRGWVNYFRIGNSSRCFGYIRDWVEKKVRRHFMKARKLRGFGWDRWSKELIYQKLGLYTDYKIRYYQPLKVNPN